MKKITIFTPTYNRAYCLRELYESLLLQKRDCFVWLVIDDGSTDNTKVLMDEFINEKLIEIRYFIQENAGKMAAHNTGVQLCDTELFMCLDSDDTLLPNSIFALCTLWDSVKNTESLAGIVAPKKLINELGKDISSPFPNVTYSTLSGLYKLGYNGETALAFRTEILKKYPFKIFHGEKFIPEGSVYKKIDKFYKLAVLNIPIMLCLYKTDGYTCNLIKHQVNSPKSMSYTYVTILEYSDLRFLKKIKYSINYVAYSLIAGYSRSQILKDISHKTFINLLYPFGWIQKKRLLYKAKRKH